MAAESAAQEPLTPDDFDQWQSISTTEISADGNRFAYTIEPVEGDGWLKVHEVGDDPDEAAKFDYADNPEFSEDNHRLAFRIGISEEERRELEEQQERVTYDLGVMNLESAEVDTFSNISGFEFSDDGKFIAMNKYKPENSNAGGRDVILRDLEEGANRILGNVSESSFNDDGSLFALIIDSYDKLGNGVHLIDPEDQSTRVLDSEKSEYKSLTWNDDGTGLAFLRKEEEQNYEEPTHTLFAFTDLDSDKQKYTFDHQTYGDFPEDHRLVDYTNPLWSDDGNRLFFGIKEWTQKEEPEEKEEEEDPDDHLDPTNVEVWHWQDDPTQPQQRVMRNQLEHSSLRSLWHLEEDQFVQLKEDHQHSITLTGDQKHAVIYDPVPHMPRFRESWNDVKLVDVTDGSRETIIERHELVQTSPEGQFLLYFREDDWWSYDIEASHHHNLTEDIDARFNDSTQVTGREYDQPHGSGQWAKEDQWVLLYDQHDIYKVSPDGTGAERITHGADDQLRHRQYRLDRDADALDADGDIYVSLFNERTKDRGYARIDDQNETEILIYESRMINRLATAEDDDGYYFQSQTAVDSPNYYYVDDNFDNPEALTNTNPQQDDYHWADDELITYTNKRGEELEGRLLYPADYDPDKEYPMMVYIYEELSQSLHSYSMPNRTNAYNQRRFSSEGYFVFMPDITYELRRPGESAVESVVPAVEKVLETSMIDEDRIGLNGHSWGAYQTSFIITQTDLFSSAVAGAPLTNMISMYNSTYWNTGVPNKTIFETSQGRFPEPYWEDWDYFVDNSPVFHMDETDTPLLLMFGTEDGAVDFNQGVELYNTMRRMGNPFVMLVYEGENHSLARKENQLDYATRAFQWHEHYLLDEDPENWIIEGLPYIDRPEIQEN